MINIWEVLKIKETKDRQEIKKAYAALIKKYNPEEYPQEFLHIREAYEAAIAYAKDSLQAQESSAFTEETGQLDSEEEKIPKGERSEGEGLEQASKGKSLEIYQDFEWNLMQENPYQEHPAVLKFRELYIGKRRKDRTVWADYFTSDDFFGGLA
ncbi:MAG: J domain-containing protein [Lachnospiraceae bacterium]|nr:J domain-containing protein [Lachnospiraceae bacterium]